MTGELIEMLRACRTPPASFVPTAEMHDPLATSAALAVRVASYVVDDVVFTVVFASVPPNDDVTTNELPLIEAIVPNAPPPKRPRKVPFRLPRLKPPAGGLPVKPPEGGVPLNPPSGGVKPDRGVPLNPPPPPGRLPAC